MQPAYTWFKPQPVPAEPAEMRTVYGRLKTVFYYTVGLWFIYVRPQFQCVSFFFFLKESGAVSFPGSGVNSNLKSHLQHIQDFFFFKWTVAGLDIWAGSIERRVQFTCHANRMRFKTCPIHIYVNRALIINTGRPIFYLLGYLCPRGRRSRPDRGGIWRVTYVHEKNKLWLAPGVHKRFSFC